MEEIWKVTTVNSDYEVSNLGNVRSNKASTPRLLKPFRRGGAKKDEDNRGTYLGVRLLHNGVEQDYGIHRLVALAFIPNPLNLPQVNHKNGIRNDNRVENLEWCDNSYNIWHSYNILGNTNYNERAICQYTKQGEFVKEWESVVSAEQSTGISAGTIGEVCKKKAHRKTAGGYIWRYKDDCNVSIEYNNTSPIIQISKYGERLKRFDTVQSAAVSIGVSEGGITGCCKKRTRGYNYAGGYLWRYEEDYTDEEFGYYADKTFVKMTLNNILVAEYHGTHDLVDNANCELIKVIMCCRGQRRSTNGFKWCIKEECDKTRMSKREKAVVKLDKDFVLVQEYNSAVEAAASNDVCASNITYSCKHKGKYNVKGYKWMYKEDYMNLIENNNEY